jgi:hypothetical protein
MGFSDEQLYGPQNVKEAVDERYGLSATEFLQLLGDGAREEVKYDIWVEAALEYTMEVFAKKSQSLFVFDDCRYFNEAEAISEDDRFVGHVIKLVCPDGATSRDPNHPSEAQVDEVPKEFISDTIVSKMSLGSVDLKEKIEAVVEAIFPGIGQEPDTVFSTTPVSMP